MAVTEVLAMVGGHVEEELLLRNEYLAAENEILKSKIEGPVRLTDPERIRLAKISNRLGRKGLEGVPCIVKPDTLLRRYRDLVARKFDGFKQRRGPRRPRVASEIEGMVERLAEETPELGIQSHPAPSRAGSAWWAACRSSTIAGRLESLESHRHG